ncbi:hypothetical protein BH24ACT2_BH24ACT2_18760 [soil metagenome]
MYCLVNSRLPAFALNVMSFEALGRSGNGADYRRAVGR